MKRFLPTLVLATSSLASAAPSAAAPSDPPPAGTARGDTFAGDLLDRWCDGTANLVFSPYSLSAALGMVAAGSRGETAQQIAAALRAGVPAAGLPAHFAALDAKLAAARQAGVELAVANALWPQQEFAFQPAYLETVRLRFGGEVTPVDYVQQTEAARAAINRWVADRTANRIRDLVAPGILSAATRMTLVNAIYFKGKWSRPFDAARTVEAPFFGASGAAKPARLMSQRAKFRYAEAEGIQALELPYAGDKLAMLVLLPAREKGVRQVAGAVRAQGTSKWDDALVEQEVAVFLPRFTFTFERSCAETLRGLGIVNAFDAGRADLSGMAGKPGDLILSAVLHKAFIEVTEEGTEAAAATAGVIALTAFMPPKPPVLFRADHPFVFVIRERETGCILFMGAVAQPE